MKYLKEILSISISAALFVPAFFLKEYRYLQLAFFLASYLAAGWEVLLSALKNILRGKIFDENFLMAIASLGALILGEYAEGVAVMLFYGVGELFQKVAVNRARGSITELMNLRPDYAYVLENGERVKKDPYDVQLGDVILVGAGEKIPLDGMVTEGESQLDTSKLTGESMPRLVKAGDETLSGSINLDGNLQIRVTKDFSQSTASKILDLVENASEKKAQSEQFITKFARYYTPIVVLAAVLLAVIPPLAKLGSFSEWIKRGLIFLVVSCPCALVISVPLSYFGGIGKASKNGILIKGGNYLEALARLENVLLDKTGTLTKGFKVTLVQPYGDFDEATVLDYAAHAESYSNHPVAKAITTARGKTDLARVSEFNEIIGKGAKARIDGHSVLVGSPSLFDIQGIEYPFKADVLVAVDNVFAGGIYIEEDLKEESISAISDLKKMGIKEIMMLTGDKQEAAAKIAEKAQVTSFRYELLPQDKVALLEKTINGASKKAITAFVGDGINDAPSLIRADIGIAMGALGTDAAIEAADIVIMNDKLDALPKAYAVAKKTRKIVIQNIVFALGVKLVVLILGAFGFASMWEAVFADVGVSVIAILNAIRLLK